MSDLLFLKLGGSLLTDKKGVEAVRTDVLDRLAREIAQAREAAPKISLLIGHGSGSFGHVAAAHYGTQGGVSDPDGWRGFAAVSAAAARLHHLVRDALLQHNVPVIGLQPSASAICENGQLVGMALRPISAALEAGLVPVVYGDVAFDRVRGGSIVSTEEILTYLAKRLSPSWLLLAGETAGVLDQAGRVVPTITPLNLEAVRPALGASRGTDVTGGMASKVQAMLALAKNELGLKVRIFSGMEAGNLGTVLVNPSAPLGTVLSR